MYRNIVQHFRSNSPRLPALFTFSSPLSCSHLMFEDATFDKGRLHSLYPSLLLLLHAHACTLCIGITLTRLALKGGGRLHETFRPSLKPRIRESWLDQMQNKHSPESTRFPSPINRENRVFNRVLNIRANLRGLERLII